jgi:uncharacterized protein
MNARAPCVAVAGLSARMLAQSASRAGLNVVALDIFGDRDTREHAQEWFDIGGDGLSIDRVRLYDALEHAARLPRMLGLIVTSGLEAMTGELSRAPRVPRFIGNGVEALGVRDPRRFFGLLDRAGIAHPEVRHTIPEDRSGWLVKQPDGCGGTHIEWASKVEHVKKSAYFQRFSRGRSMSALFVAAHREAKVIGFAEQLTVETGLYPFVHAGSFGPVELRHDMAQHIISDIESIVWETNLTGLNSIDFLLDGDTYSVLEINTRPSSTMALYEAAWPDAWPRGLIGAHLDACLHGELPPTHTATQTPPQRAGQRVVFAPKRFTVTPEFSDDCFNDAACHDVPLPQARIEQGMPVCTVSVVAPTLERLRDALECEHARLLKCIESI